MADTTTPNSTTNPPIKCPIMTHYGYDDDNDQYFCEYESWAYGIFAIVGVLFIMVPLVSLICCIVRMKAKKKYIRRLRSRVSSDSYATNSEQPLLTESTQHENPTYGAVEPLSPHPSLTDDSLSERRSKSHDNVSVASSRASLMPNYDQSSLDIRNIKATNNFQNTYNTPEVTNRPESSSSNYNTTGPYLTTDILSPSSRTKTNSPIYAVPEEKSSKSSPKPSQEYAVLEQPNVSDKIDTKPSSNGKINMKTKPLKEQTGVDNASSKPSKDGQGDEDRMKEVTPSLLDSEIPSNEPVYNVLEPIKSELVSKDSISTKEDKEHPESDNYASLENTMDNRANKDDSEPRYMTLIKQKDTDKHSQAGVDDDKQKEDMRTEDNSSDNDEQSKDLQVSNGKRREGLNDNDDKDSHTSNDEQNIDHQPSNDKQNAEIQIDEKLNDNKQNKDQDNKEKEKNQIEDKNSDNNYVKQNDSQGNDNGVGSAHQVNRPSKRERTRSRAKYQDILRDAISSFPVDERNGCFVLRDSLSSPGCKALTVYNKTPDKQQEFYNFKICFDDKGAFLAKSNKRFSTVEELLEHLRFSQDMLPCTLKNQIV